MQGGSKLKTDNASHDLTQADIEMIDLLWRGYNCKQIAGFFSVSTKTIDSRRKAIREKLGASNMFTFGWAAREALGER